MNGGSNGDDKRFHGSTADTPSDMDMGGDKNLIRIRAETNQTTKLIEHHSK